MEKEGRWWGTFGGDRQESSSVHDHVKHVAAEAAVGAQIEGRGPGWVKTSVGGIKGHSKPRGQM